MSGLNKAKGRRNAKSRRLAKFQAHPAKAGSRKVYGEVRRDKEGNILSGKAKTKTFPDGSGFQMTHTVTAQHPKMPDYWPTN